MRIFKLSVFRLPVFLSVRQLFDNVLPADAPLHHEHHGVVEEIRHLVLDLLRVGVLGRDNDLCPPLPPS